MIVDNYIRNMVIDSVVDWDTIKIHCDLWFDVRKNVKVRLARINCPELSTEEWQTSKKFMTKFVWKPWYIESLKYDKYWRGLCEVWINWENISDLIVSMWLWYYRDWKWKK